jgi:cysteine desulfurase/selenocysteine lyase
MSRNFDVDKIRRDFPILAPPGGVYFDNACMTLKPEPVIKAIEEYYRRYPACAERSNHKLGEKVNQKITEARKIVADFINAEPEEIIFTRNTTEGINLIAKSFDFKKNDEILISDKEHNSNLIPWQILKEEKGIELGVILSNEDNTFNPEELGKRLNPKVKLVSIVFVSNLDGVINPIKDITSTVHRNGSLVLVDAAQAAGHLKIDVRSLDCDFLAFSGHKVLGPTGTGVLYVKKKLMEELKPFIVGGGTVEDSTYEDHKFLKGPERFEGGLQNYSGIIGLGEAIKYLKNIGWENIKQQEYKLNKIITEGIKNLSGIKIIGPENPEGRGSIVNFYLPTNDIGGEVYHQKMPSHEIALLLDKTYNIMTRSGRHCVHSWYNSRGVKDSARASVYFYNTESEAGYFVESLKKIVNLV